MAPHFANMPAFSNKSTTYTISPVYLANNVTKRFKATLPPDNRSEYPPLIAWLSTIYLTTIKDHRLIMNDNDRYRIFKSYQNIDAQMTQ